MPADFTASSQQIRRLVDALDRLMKEARVLGVEAPNDQPWYTLLRHKLLPQAESQAVLVVAVVGGTNIGKSVVFNHLAGETASGVSPLAAGTKHPVCLVPADFDDEASLARIFAGFRLQRWHGPGDPLADRAEHMLYWRVGKNVPPRLLLLDTPDVDSDARVNWQRAEVIRESADVLIAVLTQQKYNDAAVKQFFRDAAKADKAVLVLFNQVDMQDDRAFWPQWLATFRDETGAVPELVYVAPYDRHAAGSLELPFYAVGRDGLAPPGEPVSIRHHLAELHFDAIKLRTLRGALARVVDPDDGAAQYLRHVRHAAGDFATARSAMASVKHAGVRWPIVPSRLLVDEIRTWWDRHQRREWSRKVHGFYRAVGRGILWPVRTAWDAMSGQQPDSLERFQKLEREAVVEAVAKLLEELERLADVGGEVLKPRLQQLLAGHSRERLLSRVVAAHAELPPVDDDYRAFLATQLDAWTKANPAAVSLLRSLDVAAAVARPAVTVTLALGGLAFAGDVVGQAAMHTMSHTATQVAAEAAITGGITGGGEAVLTATGEVGGKQAAARLFARLQERYATQRAAWLGELLERELLGDLLATLQRAAAVTEGEAYTQAERALAELRAAT